MAVNENPRITFQIVGKAVSWTQSKNSTSYGKKKSKLRQRSLDSAQMTEMKALSVNIKLHEIARRGDLELLRVHIEDKGFPVMVRDDNGGTLLHAAAAANQVNVLSYLLDECSGSSIIDAVDRDGNTALHVATINGHIESMHLLLDKGASDTILNKKQDPPLHTAIKSGNVEYVRSFLQHTNTHLLVQGYRQRTPLHVAAEMNLVSMVQEIWSSVAIIQDSELKEKMIYQLCNYDSNNLTPVHLAARHGSADVLDYIIDSSVYYGYTIDFMLKELDEENSTPMHAAIDGGHTGVLKVLLKHGAYHVFSDRDNSNIPPLHLACYQGRLEMVQAMVEHCGTDILHTYTAQGQSPLHWAARSIRGGQIIRYLIQKGMDVMHRDLEGNTALHSAIIFGSLEASIELLKACKNDHELSVLNSIQQNALHQAVLCNRKPILLELLKMPNIRDMMLQKDTNGMSALHHALNSGQDDLISCLLNVASSSTCLSNLKDETGSNYLHLAAKSGNWKAMNNLLMTPTGLQMLNEVDAHGGTPLHAAAEAGYLSCVRLLLSNGAMIHKCHYGYTPFLSAVYYKHVECAQALYEAHPFQQEWTDHEGNTALHVAVSGDRHCPEILKLCLNLGIPVTHNNKGETFLDIAIDTNNLPAALAVVQHPRWQECLDFPVMGDRKHPFLRFIESMPDVAEEILSKCIEKSKLSPEHPDYFQRYDFKYLRLLPGDIDVEETDDGDISEDAMVSEARLLSSVTIKYKSGEDNEVVSKVRKQNQNRGIEVLQTMLQYSRVDLLTHPVVAYYLKSKWKTYGRLIYGLHFLLTSLQVIFLSAFVLATPPTRLNLTDNFVVIDDNTTLTNISTSSTVLRFITLAFCLINTVMWFANIFAIGIPVLSIRRYEIIWVPGIALSSTYAFLLPWKYHVYGLEFVYWDAGAISVFISWVSLILYIKFYDYFGLYVTMFTEVLATLVKVLFICILFLIAFSMTFFILVGDAFPFKFIGDSFFIMFSYLLGEIDYEYYIERSNNNAIEHPVLTYLFVILAAVLLAIVVMNLLIGLAVGDIERIKKNALVRQRADKVNFFAILDHTIPKFIQNYCWKQFIVVYPNKRVSWIRMAWRHLWRGLKGREQTSNEDENIYKLLRDQNDKIQYLQYQLNVVVAQQKEHLEEVRHFISTYMEQNWQS